MLPLPDLPNFEAFKAWRADTSQWLLVALDIAHGHGLPTASPHIFSTGTNLVIGLGDDVILKLFPPLLRGQFVSERASLALLRGRLGISIPEIVFEGERDGWPYLVITRLSGVLGRDAWPALPEDQKEIVLAQIGATIADVQRVPVGELSLMEPRWDRFIAVQMAGCRARHVRLGLPPKFLDGLDDLLREVPTLIPLDTPPVILTGEYIPENFLLSRDGANWRLSGLIDFGDVMTGWGEYDLLGPSAFMAAGKPRRVLSLLEGFGYSAAYIDATLKRRLMALMLLHRASDPLRHICIEGWQHQVGDLRELQDLVWPV
ncbi:MULTISPECIES: aminoglycoside phosphotransferase family protein [Bradyrhizobium]|uniref:Hygromycin-B 7''-O-kinase n=2 Tax=Bradyrhizobium TaxID=374 RepID=A0ABY0PKW8_9BRAD|nr:MULTISPECIES: aminoglycoside 3'-phosphotransferase/choline kinase family protein [Bradyrhizobium]SDI58438.1 hygromycin-B 7''-O-kinase [Bradyrhizobium ottawaense]SED39037.1 hygromycin-B 7''-O-kinase [Bradyrhizobium lablabi]SHL40286.1 hygromycin-B 7''-O-kinase [Bradyrhizobium lablabi]